VLIDDADRFSLIVPTYEGTPFVRRCLDFLQASAFRGHVVLSDNSTGDHLAFVKSCPERYPGLWLDVQLFDADIRFLEKLARTMEKLDSRYVMLCGQDDFILSDNVEKLLQTLEADEGLSCARGRVARFYVRRPENGGAEQAAIEVNPHPMLGYQEPEPLSRVLAHLRMYASTLYSVHRRTQLIENFRLTESLTKNVIFFQYLSSSITVAQGRVACLDGLFLARQIHLGSWAARLKDDYEHWPLLVTSPKYSEYYAEFRNAVIDVLTKRSASPDDGSLGAKIDRAYVQLAKRSFCQMGLEDEADRAFFARLQSPGSQEHKLLNKIAAFTLRYPETY